MITAPARDARVRPFAQRPGGRTLEFAVLQAIADPGVVPCLVCGGRTEEAADTVGCIMCGSTLERIAVVAVG